MAIGFVSIIYGLAAGFLGYLIGQDALLRQAEREHKRRWFMDYLRMRRG